MGTADSSFLFVPVGNDLLVVALVARHHSEFWIYVLSGALGSAAGVFLLDLVARKAGEAGVQKVAGQKRFNYLKKKTGQRGGWFVALACLAPPPFPFTMLVATTSALGYPRKKLLAIVAGAKALRFLVLALLAFKYGHGILRIIQTDAFKYSAIGLAVLCLIVSGFSIAKWVTSGRAKEPEPASVGEVRGATNSG
jgi:membrane protein YqaA with SNARE-associated domain